MDSKGKTIFDENDPDFNIEFYLPLLNDMDSLEVRYLSVRIVCLAHNL